MHSVDLLGKKRRRKGAIQARMHRAFSSSSARGREGEHRSAEAAKIGISPRRSVERTTRNNLLDTTRDAHTPLPLPLVHLARSSSMVIFQKLFPGNSIKLRLSCFFPDSWWLYNFALLVLILFFLLQEISIRVTKHLIRLP